MARKAFLFDLDGVVVDNMRFHEDAWREFFARRGVAMDRDDFFRNTSGMPTRDVLAYFFKRPVTPDEASALGSIKEAIYREVYRPKLAPAPGFVEFVDAARAAGVAIGLGTGSLPENVSFVIDTLNLRCRFDAIVGAVDVKNGKPHPETFLALAGRLGVPAKDCVVFEDSLLGEKAARAAGMRLVAITTSHAACEFDRPDLAVPDFVGLLPANLAESPST